MSIVFSTKSVDVGAAYAELAGTLERIVRWDVHARDAVVEDACQFAWARLVDHAEQVRSDRVLSWLSTTAIREACRQARRDGLERSLDADPECIEHAPTTPHRPSPETLVERREQLSLVAGLPERQQRIVWLHALGLTYAEIAEHVGCTQRTVERQLLRAKRAVRQAARE